MKPESIYNMKFQLLVFLATCSGCLGKRWSQVYSDRPGIILESPRVTNFGTPGREEFCRRGEVVKGFLLKVEPRRPRVDNTALNGIVFFCGKPTNKMEDNPWYLTSKQGRFGMYGPTLNCSTYAIGFRLKSQAYQGAFRDDVAATNLKLICADGVELEGYQHDDEYRDAEYTQGQLCLPGRAICGLQTQVEDYSRLSKKNPILGLKYFGVSHVIASSFHAYFQETTLH